MWQCAVCGTSNGGDVAACGACGARRPDAGASGPAAPGAWSPAGALPADPPVAWPASAPADAFGSWSPASAPPGPDGQAGSPPSDWAASAASGNPPPGAADWAASGVAGSAPGNLPSPGASNWPTSGAPGSLPAGAANWAASGNPPPGAPDWAASGVAGSAPGNPPPGAPNWPTSGAPGSLPAGAANWAASGNPPPGASNWAASGNPPPGASNWPTSGAPGSLPAGAADWPASGGPGDLAAENWPGAGPGLGQAPPPWVAAAPPPPQPQWAAGPVAVEAAPRGRPIWIFPAIVAVVLLLGGGTVAFVLRDRWLPGTSAGPASGPASEGPAGTGNAAGPTASGTGTTTAAPTPTAAPASAAPTLPASVGAVRLDPSLDPGRAPAVAGVFDRYFAAVNARDASTALAVLDPNGAINQSDANAVKRFGDGISTSTDDDILLLGLGPDPTGKGLLQAHVTFRSRQQAGKGPKGRESETCTRWDVTYSITQPGGGEYRIWGSTGAASRPC